MPSPDTVSLFHNDIHPRMFLSPSDVSPLRERTADGFGKQVADAILQRCEQHLTAGSDTYVDFGLPRDQLMGDGGWGCPLHAPMHDFAFGALITQDKKYLDAAVRLMQVVSSGQPINQKYPYYFGYKYDAPEPIVIANLGGQLPLAFDLLFESLDETTRLQVHDYLRERVVEPYRKTLLEQRTKYAQGLGINPPWHEMFSYGWSLAAIYQHDRPEDREAMHAFADVVRRAIHLGVDENGVIGEGTNYGRHDTYRWVTNALLLGRAGVYDFWENEPRFCRMLEHWVHLLLPGRAEIYNRGDTPRGVEQDAHWPLAIHKQRTQDPAMQYAWETLRSRDAVRTLGLNPGVPTGMGYYLLWDDDQVKAKRPEDSEYPLAKLGGAFGEHVMRTGWGEDDTFFCLLSGGRKQGCHIHQHADAGHFSLFAMGEAYAIETGYGDAQANHHCVMMPRGVEPPGAPSFFDHVWQGGHTHATGSAAEIDYACVDIAWMWNCRSYHRHGWLVKPHDRSTQSHPQGGAISMAPSPPTKNIPSNPSNAKQNLEPSYALVLDDCNDRSDYAFYDWLLNTEPGNRIVLDEPNLAATIHGNKHRLDVQFALPSGDDYPLPHRIELKQDVYPSTPRPSRDPKPLGMGDRPRLIARLYGYNGVMLTALLPMRDNQSPATVKRFGESYQFGMTLDFGQYTDTIVCNLADGYLNHAGITGEARMAIVRQDQSGRVTWWSATQAYALSFEDQTLLPRRGEATPVVDGRPHGSGSPA